MANTLSKLYYGVEVHDEMYYVENKMIRYLDVKDTTCLNDGNLKTRDRLLKTLDILTLIVLGLCKRRTKPDGIIYQSASSVEKVIIEEKIENNPANP